jgi:ribosomal protein S18 acetylase RimI-like enzyme
MLDIKLRAAAHSDAKQIAELHTLSWQQHYKEDLSPEYLLGAAEGERQKIWHQRLSSPQANQHVIVATLNSKIVGFICFYLDQNPDWGSYIDNLHVEPSYKGRGFGKRLMNEAFKHCSLYSKTQGACLLVNQSNISAQQFYLKLGATNTQASEWLAPDGSKVPTFWFVWSAVQHISN